MPRSFSPATAEQVVVAVEAVVVNGHPADVDFTASFSDLPRDQAEAALKLATDLGFLTYDAGKYLVNSPLCRFVNTPNQMQKAAVLRVLLESFSPFVVFRERLIATGLAATAAQQTKTTLDLDAHREDIKDTLVSLGTYSQALVTKGGGRYSPEENPAQNPMMSLTEACRDAAAAETRIREQMGPDATAFASRDEVLVPLADALLRAKSGDARGAVVTAANAIESYLDAFANRSGVSLVGATGINAKLEKLSQGGMLPKKLLYVGKYLGHIRNAADHGVDTEVGSSWTIRNATGLEYIFVGCSFFAAITAREKGKPPEI